mmetsp:Transcript_3731/g.4342  ORF Transcript_3731/g.4342 Transcript_3731/m.4342 type:complete len:207 (+) Transcript_3731:464-1084(+)
MLKYNPKERPSASQLILHPFFSAKLKETTSSNQELHQDAFDSLKIGDNGIKIRKNQIFQGLHQNNPTKSLMEIQNELLEKGILKAKKDGMKNSEISHYPSMPHQSEETKYNDIDINQFKDSALLANERSGRMHRNSYRALSKEPSNYQNVGELKSDRVFKHAALNAIDKPPLIPKLPNLSKALESRSKRGKPKNSLRRSNTYKTFK